MKRPLLKELSDGLEQTIDTDSCLSMTPAHRAEGMNSAIQEYNISQRDCLAASSDLNLIEHAGIYTKHQNFDIAEIFE